MITFTHATPVEGLFAFFAFVSTGISIYALRDAMMDSAVLAAARVNGPRRMIADNNIHQEQLRLAVAAVMLLTAVSFLFLEPPPPDYIQLPQSLVGLIAWILVSSMLTVSSLIDKSIRKKLQRYAPMEVQTESVTVEAPDENSEHPEADIIKAAHDARADSRMDQAGRRSYDKGHDKFNQ
jgi:hypothetical protein